MANESVLIVEGTPTTANLVRDVMSEQGLAVRTASTADEAYQAFEQFRPRLVLIDSESSGIDGVELAKRLKANPASGSAALLLLAESATKNDGQKTLADGCDGCITKPIDTRTFRDLILKYLSRSRQSSGRDLPAGSLEPDQDPALRELQEEFVVNGLLEAKQLISWLDTGLNYAMARVVAHRWTGTGGSVGFPAVTQTARELSGELLEKRPGSLVRVRQLLAQVELLFTEAKEKLSRTASPNNAAPGPPAAHGVSSSGLISVLGGRAFAVAGFEPEEAARLAEALGRFNVSSQDLGADVYPDLQTARPFDVIIINAARGVPAMPRCDKPVLMIGPREALAGLQLLPHSGVDFLFSPWSEEEIALRSYLALSRAAQADRPTSAPLKAGKRRVLVADDDAIIRSLVLAALRNSGFECRVACDGEEALEIVRHWPPDLAVVDVDMPNKNGFEVLSSMRKNVVTQDIRVILLTASVDETDVAQGLELGADDYVIKPFIPMELVGRVKRLFRKQTRLSS